MAKKGTPEYEVWLAKYQEARGLSLTRTEVVEETSKDSLTRLDSSIDTFSLSLDSGTLKFFLSIYLEHGAKERCESVDNALGF